MMGAVPRHDPYSVREYGQTVRVFRLEREGPFYSEIQGKVRVIRLPRRRRIWNVRDARQWARDKHQKVRAGEPEHGTLATIFDAYLEHRSPVKATAQGRQDDKRRAAMWKAFLGPTRDPLSIERGDLDSFIQKRGYKVIDAWGNNATHGRRHGNAKASTGGAPERGRPAVRGVVQPPAGQDAGDASAATGQDVRTGARSVSSGGNQIKESPPRLYGNVGGISEALPRHQGTDQTSPNKITVRPRTVHADLQWLVTVLRRKLTDHCTVPNLRDIARDLHQSAEPRRPVATQDRYEAIIKHMEEHGDIGYLRAILVLHNGTGHRLSEILHLRWADIQLEAVPFGAIRWRSENTGNKARLERTVPIAPAVRDALEQIQRERPGIGEAWLFPGLRNPKNPTHRSVADKWLRQAEKAAGLPSQPGSMWHRYRRKWATEKKHLPLADVAEAGGWKNARTLQTVYQQSDPAGVLRVVLDATELREEKA